MSKSKLSKDIKISLIEIKILNRFYWHQLDYIVRALKVWQNVGNARLQRVHYCMIYGNAVRFKSFGIKWAIV